MKKLMIVAVAFCAALASCGGSKSAKSFTQADSVSYAVGIDIVNQFGLRAFEDSTLNGAILAAAVRDAFAQKGQMTPEDATAFLTNYFNVVKPAKSLAAGQAWLEEVKASNANIQTTESGLMYEIVEAGDQSVKATKDEDTVVVKYRGTHYDGKEFDKNDSISFPLNGVIKGWTEGMKLVGKGGQVTLWVPSELAYGPSGRGPIPGNAALKFEVTLLDVIPAPATAE